MSVCARCGHNPRIDECPHCGYPARVTTVDEHGELLMACCRKPALAKPETARGGK